MSRDYQDLPKGRFVGFVSRPAESRSLIIAVPIYGHEREVAVSINDWQAGYLVTKLSEGLEP